MTQLLLDLDADGRERDPDAEGLADACVVVRELARCVVPGDRRRKVLVARTKGEGREYLRQVALRGRSWAGFEVTTVRPLALEHALPRILAEGAKVADPFAEQAAVEEAIDHAISQGGKRFADLVDKVGFRDAVRRSVATLRAGGVTAAQLGRAAMDDAEKRVFMERVLARYEALLGEGRWVDTARILKWALEALRDAPDGGSPDKGSASGLPSGVGDRAVFLAPGLSKQGLAGQFVEVLRRRGATLLRADPAEGLSVPSHLIWDAAPAESPGNRLHASATASPIAGDSARFRIELFSAASVYDELRGVLRRVLARGARWDQVEIVATDPDTYGSALHALAGPLGVPLTFAVGLPVERTRPGRVVSAYFRWIQGGFQEPVLRALLEAGDLAPPKPHRRLRGPRLARALRRLRIGWGRDRYMAKVDRALRDVDGMRQGRYERDEPFEKRKERTRQELAALKALLEPVLKATPAVGDAKKTTPALVATGVRSLLSRVADGTETDDEARRRLKERLERIEATQKRATDFASACHIVRGFLAVRVPAPRSAGKAPWGAAPGCLHLADLNHGGATGRPHTFVVGMDSGRFPGGVLEDPFLLDDERWRVGKENLPRARDRPSETRFLFAALFARLRGHVALSCCRWDPGEARALSPAPEMLHAHRLQQAYRSQQGDRLPTFDDLEEHLGRAESRLPRRELHADLDASDVWLRALAADDGRLQNGLDAVGRAFAELGRGIEVDRALLGDDASAQAGLLGAGPWSSASELGVDRFSSSSLKNLGACPRRFFFRHVLRAFPPDDPEYDPDRWLSSLQRGALLHRVYQQTLEYARQRGVAPDDRAFAKLAEERTERESKREEANTPSPSQAVRDWETKNMLEDVLSFVQAIRDDPPLWCDLEKRFEDEALQVGDETIRVHGAIDRVDRLDEGLRVVDYKTGRVWDQDKRKRTFDGGRRFQHFVYSEVAARLYDIDRNQVRMEFHYPTRRGEATIRPHDAASLSHGPALVARMLEGVANGWFPATKNLDDCKFCDYRDVCAVQEGRWSGTRSPYTDWTRRNWDNEDVTELAVLRDVREERVD